MHGYHGNLPLAGSGANGDRSVIDLLFPSVSFFFPLRMSSFISHRASFLLSLTFSVCLFYAHFFASAMPYPPFCDLMLYRFPMITHDPFP
jgi:hypothetical protein